MLKGYGIVTKGQSQNIIQQLYEIGCRQVFTDERTNNARTGFEQALSSLQPNDILVVPKLNHLGKSVNSVIKNIGLLLEKKVNLHILDKNMLVPLAKSSEVGLIHSLVNFQDETSQAQAQARQKTLQKRGKKVGRPTKLTKDTTDYIDFLANKGYKIEEICQRTNICPSTYHNYQRALS